MTPYPPRQRLTPLSVALTLTSGSMVMLLEKRQPIWASAIAHGTTSAAAVAVALIDRGVIGPCVMELRAFVCALGMRRRGALLAVVPTSEWGKEEQQQEEGVSHCG